MLAKHKNIFFWLKHCSDCIIKKEKNKNKKAHTQHTSGKTTEIRNIQLQYPVIIWNIYIYIFLYIFLISAHSQQPDSNREPLVSERKSLITKTCNFIKKEAFPVNLTKFPRTPFLQNTSGRLPLRIITISFKFLNLSLRQK